MTIFSRRPVLVAVCTACQVDKPRATWNAPPITPVIAGSMPILLRQSRPFMEHRPHNVLVTGGAGGWLQFYPSPAGYHLKSTSLTNLLRPTPIRWIICAICPISASL
ncbi:MAG: hypothetical protein IPL59_11315 [Candidatus Competibacteraceae bacterium]|nr:hypothetical protein [Candidatus Competibacteraceae bacterium]